ncbi:MAG: DNA polymerase IV [Bacteroidetes bacterium GWF2_33_16]|nr:MAG: DNA polymerase IV [Bacteroidetes bacterium GWE2_32_14]OFY07071.1 MAG: DNA polymerase IV [Bacteroidetes bacterium GWF2_33_16]
MDSRSIVHMDLDTFFVSVERLVNSSLNGKPVIIGGMSDRGVVASCSYEARMFGVHSAMPMKVARILCPHAVYIRGDMEQYSKYSSVVTQVIAERAPVFEKASIDEHYIDITGMDKFFGSLKWTRELRQQIIKETGLPISFGLSVNKTVSKIATGEAKPYGEMNVPGEIVKPFLWPLSIKKMPMIGDKTFRSLRMMGIDTIGTLSLIPQEIMEKTFGKNGVEMWKRSNGIDFTPVKPYVEQKSMSTERTFDEDIIDVKLLQTKLLGMVEKLCYDLRRDNKLTSCITVKIRYSNFDTHTQQRRIPYTSLDFQLNEVAQELFLKVFNRRMRVRLIGVRFSHMVYGTQQLSLFDDTPKMMRLYYAIDKMKIRYGIKAIKRAIFLK